MKKIFAIILSLVLILSLTACVAQKAETPITTEPAVSNPSLENPATEPAPEGTETQPTEEAASKVEFTFIVVDKDGKETPFTIATDKTYVGEALIDEGLIEGEEGPYGLYVKTVNGQTLDYDTDGMYWSFYVDGQYGLTGVDQTAIVPGSTYMFKAEAA